MAANARCFHHGRCRGRSGDRQIDRHVRGEGGKALAGARCHPFAAAEPVPDREAVADHRSGASRRELRWPRPAADRGERPARPWQHRLRGRRTPMPARCMAIALAAPGLPLPADLGGRWRRGCQAARRCRPTAASRGGIRQPSPQPAGWVTSPGSSVRQRSPRTAAVIIGLGGERCCYVVAALNGRAPIVQRPRTPPFQGGNTGSNPVGGANTAAPRCRCVEVPWCSLECTPACQAGGRGFKSRRDRSGRRFRPGPTNPWSGSSVGRASA